MRGETVGEKLARETDMGALIDALERIADSLEQKDLLQAYAVLSFKRAYPHEGRPLTLRQVALIARHGEPTT